MKKTIAKKTNKKIKVTSKNIIDVIETTKEALSPKQYMLSISFNGQVFFIETDNLSEAIASVAPIRLKTKVLILIKKGNLSCEKALLLGQGHVIFRNPTAREVFINKLIFK